jgi:hypothetical protein
MSPLANTALRLINRNLQLTLLAGSIVMALASLSPKVLNLVDSASAADLVKLMVLCGLPVMLLTHNGAHTSQLARVVARFTASGLMTLSYFHTLLFWSSTWFVTMGGLALLALQLFLMRRFDSRVQPCN